MSLTKPRWTEEQIKFARNLRAHGATTPEIHKKLCGLYGKHSRSRTWHYVKDIQILPEYKALWEERVAAGSKYRAQREVLEAMRAASTLIEETFLSDREKLLIAAMLYWGEGTKRDLSISNTDEKLLHVFINILRDVLKIQDSRFKFSIRIYQDLDKNNCVAHWCDVLKLSESQITSVTVLQGKKSGKLQHGLCRLRILKGHRTLKFLQALAGEISKISPHSSMDRTRES